MANISKEELFRIMDERQGDLLVNVLTRLPKCGLQVKCKAEISDGQAFINIDDNGRFYIPNLNKRSKTTILTIANNDGLSQEDFESWFGLDKIRKTKHIIGFSGIIIHFTDLIYK